MAAEMPQDRARPLLHQAINVNAVLHVGAHGDGEGLALPVGNPAKTAGAALQSRIENHVALGHAVFVELQPAVGQRFRPPVALQPLAGEPLGGVDGHIPRQRRAGRVEALLEVGVVVETAVAVSAAEGEAVVWLFFGEGHLQDPPALARERDGLVGIGDRRHEDLVILAARVCQTLAVGAERTGADVVRQLAGIDDPPRGEVPDLQLAFGGFRSNRRACRQPFAVGAEGERDNRRGVFQPFRFAGCKVPEVEVSFQVGRGQPGAVGAGGQSADHAVMDGIQHVRILGVAGAYLHESPAEPAGRLLAHEDRQHNAVLTGENDRPQLRLPGNQGGCFRAVGLFVRLVERLGLPLAALPEHGLPAGVLRGQPLAVGGKRQRADRLAMAFQDLAQVAADRIDQQNFAQRSHRAITPEGQQTVVRRDREGVDAAPQAAGDLPADDPLAEIDAADVAADAPQVPDLHDLVEAGGAEPGGVGREGQCLDGGGVPVGIDPQPEVFVGGEPDAGQIATTGGAVLRADKSAGGEDGGQQDYGSEAGFHVTASPCVF